MTDEAKETVQHKRIAQVDAAAITAIGVIFTGLVSIFLKFVGDIQKSQAKRDEVFVDSMRKNTAAMKEVAKATTQQAKEAKERNGHLAELQLKSQEMIDRNYNAVQDAVANITNQHVKTQIVDTQTIKDK